MLKIFNKDEILAQEFQRVEGLSKAARLNDRHLPEDKKLLSKLEQEVREYYELDNPSP